MQNSVFVILAALIIAGIGLDIILDDGAGLIFLARQFTEFVDYVEFWR